MKVIYDNNSGFTFCNTDLVKLNKHEILDPYGNPTGQYTITFTVLENSDRGDSSTVLNYKGDESFYNKLKTFIILGIEHNLINLAEFNMEFNKVVI